MDQRTSELPLTSTPPEVERTPSGSYHVVHPVAALGHDIRSYLHIIIGNADLMLQKLANDPEQLEQMKLIVQAARDCSQLCSEALERSKPRRIDLNSLVSKLAGEFRSVLDGPHLRLTLKLASGELIVRMVPAEIERILTNLVTNAAEAMDGRTGEILIETSCVYESDLHNGLTKWARLTVSDNGCGIHEASLSKIFQAHFTTKNSGSGIGLPIIQQLVSNGGGRLSVSSTPGSGTKFQVCFRCVQGAEGG